MKFQVKNGPIHNIKTQCAIVPIFEGGKLSAAAKALDAACHGLIRQVIKRKDMEGKAAQFYLLPLLNGVGAQRVLLMGCGKTPLSVAAFNHLAQKLATTLHQHPVSDALLCAEEVSVEGRDARWQAQVLAQELALSDYRFDQHKSKKTPPSHPPLREFALLCAHKQTHGDYQRGLVIGKAVAEGMRLSKDLGNTPGNVCTPSYLAAQARRLARQYPKTRCRVLEEKHMRALGMGSLLSVTAGTVQPAKFIVLEYRAGGSQAPHVLVGKGITFDSGGISLKPGAGMDEMKYDMCGAASVLGTFRAAMTLKLPLNLVGIIAAAENMPGGRATKPGDIVTAMDGQTIEILNTDAEGRLVLCDALTYCERFKPQSVIDIATLTGACVVALGSHAHGLYSNQEDLARQLLEAGVYANDRGWQMPLWEEYDKQLKSPFADMANIGGPNAGSVTAACFLARFTKKLRWAHLDIAGTAWNKSPKGATGRPVPLLVQYLLEQGAATPAKRKPRRPAGKRRRS